MNRYRNWSMFGLVGSLAVALSGCFGGGTAKDNSAALAAAVAAAQVALEEEVPGLPGSVEALRVRNGVAVVQYHAPEGSLAPYTNSYGYGAWLGQRGFAVYSYSAGDAGTISDTFVLADPENASQGVPGDASGFSGTWDGVMLGVDASVDGDGGVLGDAQLDLQSGMSGATVDVEFSNVVGIQSRDEYDGHSWTGIAVTGSSFDGESSESGTVDGQFYGEHHEDVIGEFAYDDLAGAWGASRR